MRFREFRVSHLYVGVVRSIIRDKEGRTKTRRESASVAVVDVQELTVNRGKRVAGTHMIELGQVQTEGIESARSENDQESQNEVDL